MTKCMRRMKKTMRMIKTSSEKSETLGRLETEISVSSGLIPGNNSIRDGIGARSSWISMRKWKASVKKELYV